MGLVDSGVAVALIENQWTLVRDGKPLIDEPGITLDGLVEAEHAVALLSPLGMNVTSDTGLGIARIEATPGAAPDPGLLATDLGIRLPEGTSEATIALARERLCALREEWRELDEGQAITLEFRLQDD